MKQSTLVLLLVVTISVTASLPALGGSGLKPLAVERFPDPAQYEVGSREWFRAVEALKYRPLADASFIDNCPHDFDVLHYDITLDIDLDNELIYGNTTVLSVSQVPGLTSIDLDFTVLTVDSVFTGGDTASYVYADPVLTIDLGDTYAVDDSFDVRVVYHGHPGNEGPDGFGGFYFGGTPTMAYQMGVGLTSDPPSMGKYWFPCWDQPCDKATAQYRVTVPGLGKRAVCNGVLIDSYKDSTAVTSTYVWSETYQIAPHLMTVHGRKYAEIVDSTYDWIYYWVYPTDAADALIHFQNVDIMMDGYIERYGPYPFDKFGYAAAPNGDMEHQTCVTHVASVIHPNHLYDWLLAHEMAHQWWGDCVSVNDWRDVWLSEGFATYSEAVFNEHAYGMASYHNYMQNHIMNPVLNSGENFPIYDPINLWGTTVYEKGGCILHMLRHVVGDSIFLESLAAYREAYEYESATTVQFQAEVETVSGQDLDWFFDEWVYDRHWPEYEYSWHAEGVKAGYDLSLIIDQVQVTGPVYTMPVEVGITTVAGDTLVILWVDEAPDTFSVSLTSEPTAVELDPDNWILNEAAEVPYAGLGGKVTVAPGLRLEQNAPNPFGSTTTVRYSVPRSQHVRLEIFNPSGQKVVTLINETVPAGWRNVSWDARDARGKPVSPGTYFCRLSAEDGTRVRRFIRLR
jgi:aminopeptidase N